MSHPTLELLEQRRSVRQFSGAPVHEDHLQAILRAAQQAPNSVNGQQISLVVTRDKAQIRRIAEIAGGQPQVANADVFITIVVDFQRPAEAARLGGADLVIDQSAEGIVVGAVDVGIMLQAIQTAAAAFGYGSTAIGGIRRNVAAMVELLGLPAKTFPIVGTTLGVMSAEDQGSSKPRVPLDSFAMFEKYDLAAVKQGVTTYDAQLRHWWDKQGLPEMPSYALSTAGYYKQVYFPTIASDFARQGFQFKDA